MTTFFNAAVNENGHFKSTNQQITNLMGRYFHINIRSIETYNRFESALKL